jgi:hypothetical protein
MDLATLKAKAFGPPEKQPEIPPQHRAAVEALGEMERQYNAFREQHPTWQDSAKNVEQLFNHMTWRGEPWTSVPSANDFARAAALVEYREKHGRLEKQSTPAAKTPEPKNTTESADPGESNVGGE